MSLKASLVHGFWHFVPPPKHSKRPRLVDWLKSLALLMSLSLALIWAIIFIVIWTSHRDHQATIAGQIAQEE